MKIATTPARLVAPLLAPLAAVLLLSGCATKSYVALLPDADGSVGAVVVRGKAGEQVITRAGEGAPLDGGTAPAPSIRPRSRPTSAPRWRRNPPHRRVTSCISKAAAPN